MASAHQSEKEPLLQSEKHGSNHGSITERGEKNQPDIEILEDVQLKRHINLPYAVAIIVGNVIGSGIFVSPAGVTTNIGSVGGSLTIWGVTGIYNLCQALCYAELGTTIPRAGGDYAYLYEILGPLPGFMTCWIHLIVIASSSCAVIARTAGLYIIEPLGLNCRTDIITLIAVWIIITLATINAMSTLWGTRVHTILTVVKTIALGIVIIAGIVKLAQGYTENFQQPFQGTNTNAGPIAIAVLDGYFAYKGWELINALPEEMVNPSRDLPRAVYISLLSVTGIYVLTNVAYFTVLTPEELISSDAVALTFAERALGPVAPIIPIAVALSCMGTVNGDFLSNSRYLFAGGRYRQAPQVFSFIHTKLYTPVLAVAAMCVIALAYCVFTDLQVLQEYASLSVQIKMMLVLGALFYLRWKQPNLKRPMKVNTIVAVVTTLLMTALIVLSFYESPVVSAIGVAVFLAGLPLYGLIVLLRDRHWSNVVMDKITIFLQRILLVVPESNTPKLTVKKSSKKDG